MNYPLISEYVEAIKAAEDNLASLTYLRPVMGEDGNPIFSSGNFAVVFKMQDIHNGDYKALKCFTREQEGRAEAYKQITIALSRVESKYLINIKYLEYELYVDSSSSNENEFPVLLMDWVDGITLDKYLQQYIGNSFELHDICVEFAEMSKWLVSQSFAHGDLKPDNIIVRPNGDIVLIDYDGMYTPSMHNQKAREIGSNNYRHPQRKMEVFNCHIDDFALAAISLSLKAISISYGILDKVEGCDSFIFNEEDYYDLRNSETFQLLVDLMYEDPSISLYISTFLLAHRQIPLKAENFNFGDVRVSNLLKNGGRDEGIYGYINRNRGNEASDDLGVIYSTDGKLVLDFDYTVSDDTEINIKEGVICICEGAFDSYKKNRKLNIHLPKTIRFFTKDSLHHNYNRLSWDSPWFVYKDGFIYTKDYSGCILQHLTNAQIDSRVRIIERNCFHYMDVSEIKLPESIQKIKEYAFANATLPEYLSMPQSAIFIGKNAFSNCNGFNTLIFNDKINYMGEWCFSFNKELEKVIFPDDCDIKEISTMAFHYCSNLKQITFPKRLKKIGDEAFQWCVSIKEIEFPQSLVSIGDKAFNMIGGEFPNEDEKQNSNLTKISFPPLINSIGESAFSGCNSLKEVTILSEAINISNKSFFECDSLESFSAEYLKEISENCFGGCINLVNVNCPNIYQIKKFAFKGCSSLKYIMPESVRKIEIAAFNAVKDVIPNTLFKYEDGILYDKDMTIVLSYNNPSETFSVPDGIMIISHEALEYSPRYLSLPDSISDESIMDLITTLKCKYVRLPKGRRIKQTEQYKKAESYGHITVNALGTDDVFFDQYDVIYSADKKRLIKYPMSLELLSYSILPSCLTIEDYAFEGDVDHDPEFGTYYGGNKLTSLILPDNLEEIGVGALEGCRDLPSITLPNSLQRIDDNALRGCHSIRSLKLPSKLKFLGKDALPRDLQKIDSMSSSFKVYGECLLDEKKELLWLPPTLTKLSLPSVIMYKGHECYTYDSCIISTDGILMWTIPNIQYFEMPPIIITIGNGAFTNNVKIESLYIPEGVSVIENGAFWYNQALESIWLPSTITYIGNLKTHQGWGRKYIEFFYPQEIHIPKGMKRHFMDLLPGVNESTLIDDYK